jgi:superfamily I DNA/RNA helicase
MRGIRPGEEDVVTENRAQKQVVRKRMARTGEKYTAARRAVLAENAADAQVEPPRLRGRTLRGVLPTPKGKQKEVLALPGTGHTVVLGTAGSGKTTMAIHRAAILADPLTSNAGRVLLVTFNKTLLAYLRYWRPPELTDVSFENFHTFARGYLGSRGKMGPSGWICNTEAERAGFIATAVSNVAAGSDPGVKALFERSTRFFQEEIRFIDQYGLSDDEYIASDRFGRGGPLARELRPTVLEVRNEYRRVRQEAGPRYDWDDMAGAVLEELERDDDDRLYRHVVIDEGQDFSPQMLRSLAAAVPEGGSLTFFGDMAQQIYGRQVSWRQSGLIVPHGTWKFRRNYRNTPEIAGFGLATAAMPYFSDVPDMVEPDEFEPSGPPPALVRCADVAEETKFVIESAKEAARTGSVGVLMRRHQDEARFSRAFAGGQYLHSHMSTWDPGPGISWGTVHAAKGYEFDTVFLVGLSADAWPEPQAIRADGDDVAAADDGRLLYVGAMRAKQELIMSHVGEPTTLLPENDRLWREQTP